MKFTDVLAKLTALAQSEQQLGHDYAMASRGYYTADDIARQFARAKAINDAVVILVDTHNEESDGETSI